MRLAARTTARAETQYLETRHASPYRDTVICEEILKGLDLSVNQAAEVLSGTALIGHRGPNPMSIHDVVEYVTAAKGALDCLKGALSLIPKGEISDKASKEIEKAEKALKASEAATAKSLGYQLCQCTFPPQIMLWKEVDQAFVCPSLSCGRKLARVMHDTEDSWITCRY